MKNSVTQKYLPVAVLAVSFALGGCANYEKKVQPTRTAWKSGQYSVCENQALSRLKKSSNGVDAVLHRLELGAILRAQGKLEQSNKVFDEADKLISDQEDKAKASVTREALIQISSSEKSQYRGTTYDGIMVNTYKALNFLLLSNVENARVELRRAEKRQIDAAELNKKRIEKAQEELDKQKDKKKKVTDSESKAVRDATAALASLKAYGIYENPFAVYLDGLFFMANSVSAGDTERARKSFERASAFAPDNPHIKADLDAMNALGSGTAVPPTTYVIFETGCAPIRREKKLQIPNILGPGFTPVAYPALELDPLAIRGLTVTGGGKTETAALLSSMESVIAQEFKDGLGAHMRRAIMGAVAKATATSVANNLGGDYGQLFALGAMVFSQSTSHADTRTWYNLPKEFHVCRIATPADRKLEIAAAPNGPKTAITLADGHFNLVYVRSVSPIAPLNISQIKLK